MTIARKFVVVLGLLVLVAGPVLAPVTPAGATHTQSGYWLVTRDGQIFAFGGAAKLGESIATTMVIYNQPASSTLRLRCDPQADISR